MKKCYLGIDTSCYTTSVAIVSEREELLAEERQLLQVPIGKKGLSQSEMVFQHIRNLPCLFTKAWQKVSPDYQLQCLAVSAWPRRRDDSYMPAFWAGKSIAMSISATMRIPLFEYSHQENHIFAAIREYPELWGQSFYMLHLSGGTTDILEIQWQNHLPVATEIASSVDISAGQLIDRCGVLLGLSFPCCPQIEKLAQSSSANVHLPISRNPQKISFAGAETALKRELSIGNWSPEMAAWAVLDCIERTLRRFFVRGKWNTSYPLVAVGGVMANQYLRKELAKTLLNKGMQAIFATPLYSSDNATGNAFAAMYMDKNG